MKRSINGIMVSWQDEIPGDDACEIETRYWKERCGSPRYHPMKFLLLTVKYGERYRGGVRDFWLG